VTEPQDYTKDILVAPTAREVNILHSKSDVDTDVSAQHHTLGIRHDQSSPGDHVHDGFTSKTLTYPTAPQVDSANMLTAVSSSPVGTEPSTTSTTFVDMAGFTLAVAASAGDQLYIEFSASFYNSIAGQTGLCSIVVAGSLKKTAEFYIVSAGVACSASIHIPYTVVAGDIAAGIVTVKMQWRTSGGTLQLENRVSGGIAHLSVVKFNKVNGLMSGAGGGADDEVYIGASLPSGLRDLWVDTSVPAGPGGNCWMLDPNRWPAVTTPAYYDPGTSLMNATNSGDGWPVVPSEIITYKDGNNCSQECRVAATNGCLMRNWNSSTLAWMPWVNIMAGYWDIWKTFAAAGVAYASGVAWIGGSFTEPQIRKSLDGDAVQFRGVLRTANAAASLFTLPVGYRPPATEILSGWTDSGGVQAHLRYDITASTGLVSCSTTLAAGANFNLSEQQFSTRAVNT